LFGQFAAILNLAHGKPMDQAERMTMVVAGEGLEPPTRGL